MLPDDPGLTRSPVNQSQATMSETAVESWTDVKPFRIPRPKFNLGLSSPDVKKADSDVKKPADMTHPGQKENRSKTSEHINVKG